MIDMSNDISAIDIPHELVICLDHVGIAVPDLDAAVEFYRSAFGWVNHHQETNEEQGVTEAMIGPKHLKETDGMINCWPRSTRTPPSLNSLIKKAPACNKCACAPPTLRHSAST